jgi:hypothetical protein
MTNKPTLLLSALLVTISAVSSLAFACVTPFAAFAVSAAYMPSARASLLTMAGVWLMNQMIGFGFLGYPWTADCILWGVAIAAAALLAGAAASATMRLAKENRAAGLPAALIAAFAAYEASLFLVTFALGGQDTFAPAILGHLALVNAGWAVALTGMCEMLRFAWSAGGRSEGQPYAAIDG